MTTNETLEQLAGYWRGRALTRDQFANEDAQCGLDAKVHLQKAAEYEAKAKQLARWAA